MLCQSKNLNQTFYDQPQCQIPEAIYEPLGSAWLHPNHTHPHNLNAVNGHPSEHAMDSYMVSHVIYNDGTLDDLSDEVFMLAKELDLDK